MASGGFSKPLFVAAIDIGSTHSGYALLDLAEGKFIKTKVWNARSRSLMSHKTPTALLLNPDKSFKSFGYRAEDDYSQLVEDGEEDDYYYFHRFKMIPNIISNLRKQAEIMENTGRKSLPAIEVFSHSIRFLTNHSYSAINVFIGGGLEPGDIQYVLTVPAIWDDKAKQFMREAARRGGIERDRLIIVPEPEAALMHCQPNPLKTRGDKATYMVVDLGGASTNITLLQRNCPGTGLNELHQTTGRGYGGKSVDEAFEKLLGEIVGPEKLKDLRENSMEDFIDIFREFEAKKCSFDPTKSKKKESVALPVALTCLVKLDKNLKTMDNAIKQSKHNKDQALAFTHQKLQVSSELFNSLFQPTIVGIIKHMENIFYDSKFQHVDTIVMVGGFSECKLVQDSIQNRFTLKKVIIPEEPGLAVLKGAVAYGQHVLMTSLEKLSRYAFGFHHWPMFNKNRHPLNKLMVIKGELRCKDVFYTLKESNYPVASGDRISHVFQVLAPNESELNVTIYLSRGEEPRFIDDEGCESLGILTVHLDSQIQGPVELTVTLAFQTKGVVLEVKKNANGQQYETTFDFEMI